MDHATIHLLHLFILGPLLLLIGLGLTDNWVPRPVIAILGALIMIYHLYRAYSNSLVGKPLWVNLLHLIVIGPILLGYGYTGERWLRELILLSAFAAIGYHGYYAIRD